MSSRAATQNTKWGPPSPRPMIRTPDDQPPSSPYSPYHRGQNTPLPAQDTSPDVISPFCAYEKIPLDCISLLLFSHVCLSLFSVFSHFVQLQKIIDSSLKCHQSGFLSFCFSLSLSLPHLSHTHL